MTDLRLEATLLTYLREKRGEGFAERLRYRMRLHFRSLSLENQSVLEIGAGAGFFVCVSHEQIVKEDEIKKRLS